MIEKGSVWLSLLCVLAFLSLVKIEPDTVLEKSELAFDKPREGGHQRFDMSRLMR